MGVTDGWRRRHTHTHTTGTPPACLVVNGGFETGNLPPWTNTGDTSFTGVDGEPALGNLRIILRSADLRRFY